MILATVSKISNIKLKTIITCSVITKVYFRLIRSHISSKLLNKVSKYSKNTTDTIQNHWLHANLSTIPWSGPSSSLAISSDSEALQIWRSRDHVHLVDLRCLEKDSELLVLHGRHRLVVEVLPIAGNSCGGSKPVSHSQNWCSCCGAGRTGSRPRADLAPVGRSGRCRRFGALATATARRRVTWRESVSKETLYSAQKRRFPSKYLEILLLVVRVDGHQWLLVFGGAGSRLGRTLHKNARSIALNVSNVIWIATNVQYTLTEEVLTSRKLISSPM